MDCLRLMSPESQYQRWSFQTRLPTAISKTLFSSDQADEMSRQGAK
jgi:hypothetical protein